MGVGGQHIPPEFAIPWLLIFNDLLRPTPLPMTTVLAYRRIKSPATPLLCCSGLWMVSAYSNDLAACCINPYFRPHSTPYLCYAPTSHFFIIATLYIARPCIYPHPWRSCRLLIERKTITPLIPRICNCLKAHRLYTLYSVVYPWLTFYPYLLP